MCSRLSEFFTIFLSVCVPDVLVIGPLLRLNTCLFACLFARESPNIIGKFGATPGAMTLFGREMLWNRFMVKHGFPKVAADFLHISVTL